MAQQLLRSQALPGVQQQRHMGLSRAVWMTQHLLAATCSALHVHDEVDTCTSRSCCYCCGSSVVAAELTKWAKTNGARFSRSFGICGRGLQATRPMLSSLWRWQYSMHQRNCKAVDQPITVIKAVGVHSSYTSNGARGWLTRPRRVLGKCSVPWAD